MAPVPPPLDQRILASLDGLLHALELAPTGDDRFVAPPEPDRFTRVFGGQTLAQALLAAGATVGGPIADHLAPHSLHAYFVQAGVAGHAVEVAVERVRDGRTMATRRSTVTQGDRTLLVAIASFHDNPDEPVLADPLLDAPLPLDVPLLQDWLHDLPPALAGHGRAWVDHPPPLDLRIAEAPTFLGGTPADGARAHWMRLPRDVGDDRLLHTVLLAYASDYLLLDMAFRSYPGEVPPGGFAAVSVDHALWFHRPVQFDRWHLHTQEIVALAGHRGLVRGSVHDEDGRRVATVMQEVLVRPNATT
ncbi:MAG TPA: acyl-CoA thioesterase domain-containing protein [Acidimicrobiia bacterium]|jgi:acyl-CoA thioesterase-2